MSIHIKEVTEKEKDFYHNLRHEYFVKRKKLYDENNFDSYDVLSSTKHYVIHNDRELVGVFRLITGSELPALNNIKNFPAKRCVEFSRLIITDKCPVSRLELLRFLYDFCIVNRFEYIIGEALDEELCRAFKRVFSKSMTFFGKVKIKDPNISQSEEKFCYPIMVNITTISENPIFKKLGK